MGHLRATDEAGTVKHTRFALQRGLANRTAGDQRRIANVMFDHEPLFRAWCLKEALVAILDLRSVPERARAR